MLHSVAHHFSLFCLLPQSHVVRDKTGLYPYVPAAFAAKCFPDLLQPGCSQPVQLYITVDTEGATESTSTAAGSRGGHYLYDGAKAVQNCPRVGTAPRLDNLLCIYALSKGQCPNLSCLHTFTADIRHRRQLVIGCWL
jgi:hypothetical protein